MSRNPTNWNEYQYGTSASRSSISSAGGRSVRFHEDLEEGGSPSETSALMDVPHEDRRESNQELRRRRSSITMRFNTLTRVGGVNSIENFARSWTRAAEFAEVIPQRPQLVLHDDQDVVRTDEHGIQYGRMDPETGTVPRTSLLRAQFGQGQSPSDPDPEAVIDDDSSLLGAESDPNTPRPLNHQESESKRLGHGEHESIQGSIRGSNSIFAIPPHLATPLVGSYGTSYGTLTSNQSRPSMEHAAALWKQQQSGEEVEGEREPVLVKEVRGEDGEIAYAVVGQSTLPQTVFNSTNVLIGVGLLSLPMGIKYSGWLCGMIFLALSAVVTAYTARLLAKCLDEDERAITFADVAYISYGEKARVLTSILFTLELLAACVALVVLFADTLDLLIPGYGVDQWKILCGLVLIPLNFAPLKLLSFSSVLGIFSCMSIVLIMFIDGLIKPTTPGSLLDPAQTYLFPDNWLTLPLSFGLLMSPWGGHSVFPNIYRDMRHPHKYHRAVKTTFIFTYILDCITAAAGYAMFGDLVMTEITANILQTRGYPPALNVFISIFIAIIPLTKVPLNARPIVSTIETIFGLQHRSIATSPALTGLPSYARGIGKIAIRVIVLVVIVIIAIVFPAFDSIMAFMGSTLCFAICVILPLLFYLKIFAGKITLKERIMAYFLITICSVLAVIGTIWAFLPKSLIGAE